jgi:hypothetical protein
MERKPAHVIIRPIVLNLSIVQAPDLKTLLATKAITQMDPTWMTAIMA